jgi:hypothetical protein
MLVAAAVCPCTPLLVPLVAAGAAPELDTARTACADALAVLAAARPDLLVVVGPAGPTGGGTYPRGATGSLDGFGVDVAAVLGESGDDEAVGAGQTRRLPPSLTVAAWLLDRVRWGAAPPEGLGVAAGLETGQCLHLGREAGKAAGRVALLVMGDGSNCRTLKAPGYLDERAEAFDAGVAAALAGADTQALAGLDTGLARELGAAGRAPWQVLAGAADGAGLTGRLLYDEAPYGVGYFVAAWA